MLRLNVLLLVQSAVVTTAAAPSGMPSGEWIALASLFIVMAGVVYRTGANSQKMANVEATVVAELGKLGAKLDDINGFIKDTQELRVVDARWKADIGGRVERLEEIQPIHIHKRATDDPR